MPASRVCRGCSAIIASRSYRGRCAECNRDYEEARGRRAHGNADPAHARLRARYQREMDAGRVYPCWRCGGPVDPADWHLGHHDDRTYAGPEHPACNLRAAGRASHTPGG